MRSGTLSSAPFLLAATIFVVLACAVPVGAQNAPNKAPGAQRSMAKSPATGLVRRVVAGSNRIKAYQKPDEGSAEAYVLDLLQPYYVMEEASGGILKITSVPAITLDEGEHGTVGYVRVDQVYEWDTREALHFLPGMLNGDRKPIEAWDDEAVVRKFIETSNKNAYPASLNEDINSTLKRVRSLRPYPVIRSFVIAAKDGGQKRIYEVLLPVVVIDLPPGVGKTEREILNRGPFGEDVDDPAMSLVPLDTQKKGRLEQVGAKLNVDGQRRGILVQRAFVPDNPDLLAPKVSIDKETLERFILVLLEIAEPRGYTPRGVDVIIADMAGERPGPDDDIASLLGKRLGVQLRTNLFSSSLMQWQGLLPSERLVLTKRMKAVALGLNDFLEANLHEFDKLGSVWMPVSLLP